MKISVVEALELNNKATKEYVEKQLSPFQEKIDEIEKYKQKIEDNSNNSQELVLDLCPEGNAYTKKNSKTVKSVHEVVLITDCTHNVQNSTIGPFAIANTSTFGLFNVSGNNLCFLGHPVNYTFSQSGITWTVREDGSIYIKGTVEQNSSGSTVQTLNLNEMFLPIGKYHFTVNNDSIQDKFQWQFTSRAGWAGDATNCILPGSTKVNLVFVANSGEVFDHTIYPQISYMNCTSGELSLEYENWMERYERLNYFLISKSNPFITKSLLIYKLPDEHSEEEFEISYIQDTISQLKEENKTIEKNIDFIKKDLYGNLDAMVPEDCKKIETTGNFILVTDCAHIVDKGSVAYCNIFEPTIVSGNNLCNLNKEPGYHDIISEGIAYTIHQNGSIELEGTAIQSGQLVLNSEPIILLPGAYKFSSGSEGLINWKYNSNNIEKNILGNNEYVQIEERIEIFATITFNEGDIFDGKVLWPQISYITISNSGILSTEYENWMYTQVVNTPLIIDNLHTNSLLIRKLNESSTSMSLRYIQNPFISFIDKVYPVGSIYLSMNSTNPSLLFNTGGWKLISTNRMLIGAGDKYTVGATGGAETVALTKSQVPKVEGTISMHNGATATNIQGVEGCFSSNLKNTGTYMNQGTQLTNSNTQSYGRINFTNEGKNEAHNNMPPYYAVYMWQRIA